MGDLTVPHDYDAERSVLGAMLTLPTHVAEASWQLDPGDFYRPAHAAIWTAIRALHERGAVYDAKAVLNECAALGEPVEAVDIMAATTSATGAWQTHVIHLVELRARRELQRAALEVLQHVTDPAVDIDTLGAIIDGRLSTLARPSRVPDSLGTVSAAADRTSTRSPWIIPGLLRRGWRAVVVGTEGGGKSWLLRQCAVAAAGGIHPLTFRPMEPICTLLVDLENPEDAVTDGLRPMRDLARLGSWDDTRAWIWEAPGGIDLRSRRHWAELEAALAQIRPDLVCLGPVYKAYAKVAGERGHEDAVRHLQSILDDLRTRHRFALLMEHHAPIDASNGTSSKRVMRPADTALWLRWPELGIAMVPDPQRPVTVMHLRRYRGDRVKCSWPDRIEYGTGGTWPWVGFWKNGIGEQW